MGILDRLFGKKELEAGFKKVEEELKKLKKKTNSDLIAIMGTAGRLKGLPLIYDTNDEGDLKKLSARLYEILNPINNLMDDKSLLEIRIAFFDAILYFKPISTNASLFALLENRNNILPIKQWVYKNESELKELFHD